MAENLITCPQCRAAIPLSEALSHQMREQARRELDQAMAKQKADFDADKKVLAEQVAKMKDDARRASEEAARKLQSERESIEKEAIRRFEEKNSVEKRNLELIVQEQRKKLEETQRNELELLKKQRELEEQKRDQDLELQRKLTQEVRRIEEQTLSRVAQENHQKELEAAKREADFRKTIEELRRKVEQGSQQTQGEVVELELELLLRDQFPNDVIEPVAKGVRGADVVQRVFRNGKPCGTIVWELKQTKAWSDGWIEKLKVDRDAAKADTAVLVSAVLPKGVSTFAQVGGIWVTNQTCLPSLAATLRWTLVELARTRGLAEGKHGKMETLYAYLSGSEFRQRVEAIHDGTRDLLEQLESERRLFEKNWSARHKMIVRVANGLLNMRGDLEGLGTSLEHIDTIDGNDAEIKGGSPRAALPPPVKSSAPTGRTTTEPIEEDDQLF